MRYRLGRCMLYDDARELSEYVIKAELLLKYMHMVFPISWSFLASHEFTINYFIKPQFS